MSSPTRKSNHTPSILFNEEAEKTANFLPIIDQRSSNTTPRNSIQQTPSAIQGANVPQSIHAVFKINQRVSSKRQNLQYEGTYQNTQQKKNSQSYQQDILEGLQQRSKEVSNSRDFMLHNDSATINNYGPQSRKSSQISQNLDKSGSNLYNSNYGYQVNLERDLKLNQSYEVDINSSLRQNKNIYSNSINSSLMSISNQSKYRSQSCKRKPTDQLLLGSIDFSNNNQIYAFTPQSAPHGQIEGSIGQRKVINQIKTLSHPPHSNIQEQYQQQSQQKVDSQIPQSKIKESTTPHPLSNPFDPLKQETQIYFETDGCRKKLQEEFLLQNDQKRDNRFPKGFFIQTPTSSKRRTIRLNQNIYQTPMQKKDQIQSFSNINEYQFTFGDEETDLQEQKSQLDFYHNIQSSKNYNMMYQSQQYGQSNPNRDSQVQDKLPSTYNQNEKQKEYLNQQITKNDICRSVAAKQGISLSANQQRPEEMAVIEQVTFGLFPIKDHNSRNSSDQNDYQIIHTPQNESPVQTSSAGVRKYSKPKSLLFKKMFEKMNSLVDDQKKTDSTCMQSSNTTNNSPVNYSERIIPSSISKQDNCYTKIFRSRQSSPKNKQFKPPNIRRQVIPASVLEQIQNADEQIQQINKNQDRENEESPHISGFTFSTPNSLEASNKDSQEVNENQVYLNFQKKIPIYSSNSQHGSPVDEGERIPKVQHQSNTSTKKQKEEQSTQLTNQNNDKLNKWLFEHNQFKQSNIADYQQYNGISCYSVSPQRLSNNSTNQITSSQVVQNTFVDKTRLYNNMQTPKQHQLQQQQQQQQQQQSLASELQIKNIQPQLSNIPTIIQTQKESTKKEKIVSKRILQVNPKLSSASDLDIQNTQSTQISKSSPKSIKKKKIIRKQGSLQMQEQLNLPDENELQKQNLNKLDEDEKLEYRRISQDSIQIKSIQKSQDLNHNSQNTKSNRYKDHNDLVLIKKISKEKKDLSSANTTKNIGPWIDEKYDEDDTLTDHILKNQKSLKIQ